MRIPARDVVAATGVLVALAAIEAPMGLAARDRAGQALKPGLAGTAWQLVRIEANEVTTVAQADRARYTIAFEADGGAALRVDCNRGRGTWRSDGEGQVRFGPLALTRAMCPPGSLHDRFANALADVRTYVLADGRLSLHLKDEGGSFEFEPVPRPPSL